MSDTMSPFTVKRLDPEDCREAVEVLSRAFHDYPVMRFVVRSQGAAYESGLRRLVEFFTGPRFPRGHPVLGMRSSGGEIVGVASLDPPEHLPETPETIAVRERTKGALGEAARARLRSFDEVEGHLLPSEPHYYLGMLGVVPESQGLGLARELLEAVHELSRQDPASRGVALTTELPRNVQLYEHFGYRLSDRVELEGLTSWGFFRPDDPI